MVIVKHIQGVPNDGKNCWPMPKGKVLLSGEGDHRLCPAAIAVDTETGVEAEWPSHWPTRRKWDAETGLPTDW